MIPQSPTVLCGVSPIRVVLTMQALIVPYGVSSHLIWPFKEWLILDLFQNLVHWLSEYCINYRALAGPACPAKSLWGRLFLYQSYLKFLISLGITLAFPFPCYWSSSTLLYLSILSMSWRTLVAGFLVKDFLKLCLVGRPTLKVLMAISSKSPSISLNISRYLSEYIFKVPPSCMVKDSRESKGRGTQLQVMKREPNAQVSLWRNLWSQPLGHRTISSPQAPN